MQRDKETKRQRFFSASLQLCFSASLHLCIFISLLLCILVQRGTPAWAKTQPERAIVIDEVASPTGELKEKVQEIRQLVREKVQEKLAEIKNRQEKRAYVGKISAIENTTITLESKKGAKKVLVNEETTIVGALRKTLKLADLKVGDAIIAMGTIGEDGAMTAKRIVVIPQSLTAPTSPKIRRAVFGRVKEIDRVNQILTLVHPKKEQVTFRIKVPKDPKAPKVDFSQIAVGDRLVAVGTWDEAGQILTAKIIHIVPGKALGLEKPSPTPKP